MEDHGPKHGHDHGRPQDHHRKRHHHGHDDKVLQHVRAVSLREPTGMAELVEATAQTDRPMMATSPEQGQFLAFLIKSIGATQALEIGVFTGVGTMWMADAVGADGTVVACDISEEYPAICQPIWEKAGVADRIYLRVGPADQTLKELATEQAVKPFDFCYIDANKEQYDTYYELALPLMRAGGIIAFDNMLLGGRVADPAVEDERVAVIRNLSAKLRDDERVDVSFLPMGDGLYLARKR